MRRSVLLYLVHVLPLCAAELSPYFPPLCEPCLSVDYLYEYMKEIQSPRGDFSLPNQGNNL